MAKRFTDTDKWKKPWFRKLKPRWKAFWEYLRDNCDHAGIWEVDFELAQDFIKEPIDPKTALEVFAKQVHVFAEGRRWFILDFIEFQYGELNPKVNAHKSAIAILRHHRIQDVFLAHLQRKNANDGELLCNPSSTLAEGLVNPWPRDQDKDQDKDLDKDSLGKEGSGENPNSELPEKVIAYLNERTGKAFKAGTVANRKPILARAADGFTEADFRKVIDNKVADWLHDPRMESYLRPETLFRPSKFESYLNQINAGAAHASHQGRPGIESQAERNARAARENFGPFLTSENGEG